MNADWISEYIKLALRMDRTFSREEVSNFLDNYYGPAELKNQVNAEEICEFPELAKQADELLEQLPAQQFDGHRAEYLQKHTQAVKTVAEMRSGKHFSFYELVEGIFDIQPAWIAEHEFEAALKLIDQALPGGGDVQSRYQSWQEKIKLPKTDPEKILHLMQATIAEARRRTEEILPLPQGENVDIHAIHGVDYGAANWYQGGYRSRLELNIDRSVYLPALLYQICHEGYPGHHTESCLKEFHIFQRRGWWEQSLFFTFGPQLVISEGIASLAAAMIFTPGEAAEWLREWFKLLLPAEALDVDLEKILGAFMYVTPDDLSSNLATLVEAGRSHKEIVDYALAYTTYSREQIEEVLPWLGSPLSRLYSFTYSHGKRLIEPLLIDPQRNANIRMLLTEPITPSRIAVLVSDQMHHEEK